MKLSDLVLVSMIDKFRLWTIAGEETGKVNHNGATATTKEILTYKDYEVDNFSVDNVRGIGLVIDVYMKQKCIGYRPYKPRYTPGLAPIDNNDSITLSPKIDCDMPKGELRAENSEPTTKYYTPGDRGFAK